MPTKKLLYVKKSQRKKLYKEIMQKREMPAMKRKKVNDELKEDRVPKYSEWLKI